MSTLTLVLLPLCLMPAQVTNETISRDQAEGLLQAELQGFQERPNLSYAYTNTYELVGGNEGPNASLGARQRGFIRWGGDRVEVEYLSDRWEASLNEYRPGTHEHRVWKVGRALGLRTFNASPRPSFSQAFTHKMKIHDSVHPDMTGWFLDGVFIDSDHYAESLLKATDLTAGTDPEYSDLVRIEGTTEQGLMVVWLDAEVPHLLRRARFEAGRGLLSQISDIEGFTLDVAIERYEKVDGVPIAAKGVGTYTYDAPGDAIPHAKQNTVHRSDIVVDPDFIGMGAFQIDFPGDTVISDYDDPDTQYRWVNGKPIPFARPDFDPSQAKSTGSELLEFTELQESTISPHVSIESNTPTKLALTLQGKPLHNPPHAISLKGLESNFVDPLYATIQEAGYLDVVFTFKKEKDSSRRIRLGVTLIDANGNTLESFTRVCKNQRINYDRATARGSIRVGGGGNVVPNTKENHEEFWTLHKTTRSILLSAEEIYITFEEVDR